MTVCIGGIHEARETGYSIILITDSRVSTLGGSFSEERHAKYKAVHRDWIGMYAGSIEETYLILKEISSHLLDAQDTRFETVVDYCRSAYSKIRIRLIETTILPEFDVATYKQYRKLRRSDEALYLTISDKIRETQENWNILIAGFDQNRSPHIFVIYGPGNIQYCDSQKVMAIGSGSLAALIWLSFYGYHPTRPIGELLFGALSAKFFAERAQDVGPATVLTVINHAFNGLIQFNADEIDKVRTAWEHLPKFSPEVVEQLEHRMAITYNMLVAHRNQLGNL